MLRLCCLVEAKQQRDSERGRIAIPTVGKRFSPEPPLTALKWRGSKSSLLLRSHTFLYHKFTGKTTRSGEHDIDKENEASPSNDMSHTGWDLGNIIADGESQPNENGKLFHHLLSAHMLC